MKEFASGVDTATAKVSGFFVTVRMNKAPLLFSRARPNTPNTRLVICLGFLLANEGRIVELAKGFCAHRWLWPINNLPPLLMTKTSARDIQISTHSSGWVTYRAPQSA